MFKFLNDNAGAFSFFATVVLAVFTCLLWWSTRKLWQSGKETFEASERAFVFLDSFVPELTTAAQAMTPIEVPHPYVNRKDLFITRFALRPRWRNSGTTPTVGMTINVDWAVSSKQFPPTVNFRNKPIALFVPPGGTEASQVIEIPQAQSLVTYGLSPLADEPGIWVWGRADYRDVFGKAHFVEWCYELAFDALDGHTLRAKFIQYGEHNRTDGGRSRI